MNDSELAQYLEAELGLQRSVPRRAGLDRAVSAFLGTYLEQRTPIQEQAIEIIYDGTDVLLVSATASGKTEAAIAPIAARLISDPARPVALYLAPTRALLNDLHRRLEAPLHQLGLDAVIRHGERRLPTKTSTIRVIFTTPESLDVLLSNNFPLLSHVKYVIVDEIHQLFGTPRGDQLGFVLQRLEHVVGHQVQRVALSATVGRPRDIAVWLCPQRQPAQVITAAGARPIVGSFRWMPDLSLLQEWLRMSEFDKVLYFVNSRRRCDDVYLALRDLQPYESFVHYSTLTTAQRQYVERGFKSAQMASCVATTTLELGIDIGSIQEVVLVDPPNTVSSFLQRIGRGGRRGPCTYATLTPSTTLELLQFAAMLKLAEGGLIEAGTAGHPYSVFIQQVFSILAGKRQLRIHPDELAEQFQAFSWLKPDHIDAVVDSLGDQGFLRRDLNWRVYEVGPGLEELINQRSIYTNISGQAGGTPVFHSGRRLAYLPLRPNDIRHGNVILFAGRFWQIVGISDRGLTVKLVPPVSNAARPAWSSKGSFATSATLSRGMRDVLLGQPPLTHHEFDAESSRRLAALYDRSAGLARAGHPVFYERAGPKHVYYTFAGALQNQLLQLLFDQNGTPCQPAARAEGIALISEELLDFDSIPNDGDAVISTAAAHWRRFGGWITSGPFFDHLPPTLKRDETMAQVATPEVLEGVTALSAASVVAADLQLIR